MSNQSRERRRLPRYRLRLAVRYWNDACAGRAITTDLSDEGLFLEGVGPELVQNMRIHLEVALPDGPFLAEARVLRILPPEADSGRPRSAALRLLVLLDCVPGAGVRRRRD